MTVGLSVTNTANAMLNGLRNVSFAVSGTWVGLHTADPGASGGSAGSAGSAVRVAATFGAASAGAIALTGTQPAWTNGGTSETVTHISVWDAETGGNFLWSAQLASGKSWADGDTITLTSCGLSLSPLAAD